MTIRSIGAMLALVCVVAACGSKEKQSGEDGATPAAAPGAEHPVDAASAIPAYNIGDVEYMTRAVVQVSQRSLTPTVEYQELGTLREKVTVANAMVKAPHPAEFWIKSSVESRGAYRKEDTVYLKAEVKAEGIAEPLAVNAYVVSGNEIQGKPQTVEINLMEKLNPLPKSVLIQTYLTLVWFPDTSPMTVDAANPDLSKGQTQEIRGNTLRINFE